MTQTRSILVCILPDPNARNLEHFVANVASFAGQMGADIHFVMPKDTEQALNSAVSGATSHKILPIKTIYHPIERDSVSGAAHEVLQLYSCDFLVVSAGSIAEGNGYGAAIRRNLLEKAAVPVLILSQNVDLGPTPVRSVLVPMSGEMRVSSALKFGLNLASRIHVPLDLVHVVSETGQVDSALDKVGDQAHHEYRDLVDRILAEGSPFSGAKEKGLVRNLYHARGTPSVEVLKLAENSSACALVVEWHGSLMDGRAETAKHLVREAIAPVFLVKAEAEQRSTLKIGPENRVA